MKFIILLLTAILLALPLSAGCKTDDSTQDSSDINVYVKDDSAVYSQQTDETSEVTVMYITINSEKIEVELAQNSSVDALVEILRQNDISYTADDYGNFEKVGNIGYTLPRNDEEITTEAGDVILYQGCNICLYYGTNTWSFTRIGKINSYTTSQLKELLCAGSGTINVTLSLN